MTGEWRETGDNRPEVSTRQRDQAIATFARNRHRVASLDELLRLGLSADQIKRRVADARLRRKFRSVYVVGPGALTDRGEWLAAALFAAPDGVVSHRDAACLTELIEDGSATGVIHVICPRRISPPPKIRAHQSRLPRDERTILHNVPTTTTGRTLLDCAALGATSRDIERMLIEAYVKVLPIRPSLTEIVNRYPSHRGVTSWISETSPQSRRRDPPWGHQRRLRLACRGVAIELDAPSTHGSSPRMLSDRRRDRALILAGWTPGRLMEEDLLDEDSLAREMRGLLDP